MEPSSYTGWQEVDFNTLEFGRLATDHQFVADYKEGAWTSLRIVPFAPMMLSPFTAALHYGQTVFEGMKAYRLADGRISIFRSLDHARRMNRSLERMCMPTVPESLFVEAIDRLVDQEKNWVSSLEGTSLYIRPFVFAMEHRLGVRASDKYRFMVVCSPVGKYYDKPLRVRVEQSYARAFPGGTGFAKCGGNYGVSFYPYQKAHEDGYDQVLWTDAATHRHIEESGTMNVGFVVGNTFMTPPAGETVLAGITRDSVLHVAARDGLKVEVRSIDYREITGWIEQGIRVEAFGIGTAATIAPICEIAVDGKPYETYVGADAVMYQLKKGVEDIRLGRASDSFNWNRYV